VSTSSWIQIRGGVPHLVTWKLPRPLLLRILVFFHFGISFRSPPGKITRKPNGANSYTPVAQEDIQSELNLIFSLCKRLRRLEIRAGGEKYDLSGLSRLVHLRSLYFSCGILDSTDLSTLAKLQILETEDVSAQGLEGLQALINLQCVSVTSPKRKFLVSLPSSISELHLSGISKDSCKDLYKFKNLRVLGLSRARNIDFSDFSYKLENVDTLILTDINEFSNLAILLENFPKLKTIRASLPESVDRMVYAAVKSRVKYTIW